MATTATIVATTATIADFWWGFGFDSAQPAMMVAIFVEWYQGNFLS